MVPARFTAMAMLTMFCYFCSLSALIFAAQSKWYVAQRDHAQDVPHCGNLYHPCRTVRFTVGKASSGDTIYIDHAHGPTICGM